MCSATQLSSGVAISRVFATVGFNSEDARKSWNFPQGELNENRELRCMYHRASDRTSAGSSLLLTLAVYLVLSSFSLITESSNYRLCRSQNSRDISQHN